jgi:hypothetical protein
MFSKKVRLTLGSLVVGAAAAAFTVVGAIPADAATYLSGTTYCAGGPTAYAGVRAYMNTGNSFGSVVFDNLNTGAQVSYVLDVNPGYHTEYSPWSSTKWELAMQDVSNTSSACY